MSGVTKKDQQKTPGNQSSSSSKSKSKKPTKKRSSKPKKGEEEKPGRGRRSNGSKANDQQRWCKLEIRCPANMQANFIPATGAAICTLNGIGSSVVVRVGSAGLEIVERKDLGGELIAPAGQVPPVAEDVAQVRDFIAFINRKAKKVLMVHESDSRISVAARGSQKGYIRITNVKQETHLGFTAVGGDKIVSMSRLNKVTHCASQTTLTWLLEYRSSGGIELDIDETDVRPDIEEVTPSTPSSEPVVVTGQLEEDSKANYIPLSQDALEVARRYSFFVVTTPLTGHVTLSSPPVEWNVNVKSSVPIKAKDLAFQLDFEFSGDFAAYAASLPKAERYHIHYFTTLPVSK